MRSKYRKIGQIRKAALRMLKRHSLEHVCRELGILNDRGEPNPGLLHNIAFGKQGQEYEPMDEQVRKRLGMRPICPTCKRPKKDPDLPKPAPKEWEIFEIFWRRLTPAQRKNAMKHVHHLTLTDPAFRMILLGDHEA